MRAHGRGRRGVALSADVHDDDGEPGRVGLAGNEQLHARSDGGDRSVLEAGMLGDGRASNSFWPKRPLHPSRHKTISNTPSPLDRLRVEEPTARVPKSGLARGRHPASQAQCRSLSVNKRNPRGPPSAWTMWCASAEPLV